MNIDLGDSSLACIGFQQLAPLFSDEIITKKSSISVIEYLSNPVVKFATFLEWFCQLRRSTASSCIEAWTIRLGRPGLEGMENVAISHQWTLLGYIICLTIAGRYRDVSSKKKCIHNITLMYCSEGSFRQAASCVSHLDIYTFVHRFKCNVWGPRKTNHVIFAD